MLPRKHHLSSRFTCSPIIQIHKAWTPTVTIGHCSNKHGIVTGIFVYSVINVALTLYYALAVVPLIWKLQLRLAVKLSALFVLCVGFLYVFASSSHQNPRLTLGLGRVLRPSSVSSTCLPLQTTPTRCVSHPTIPLDAFHL